MRNCATVRHPASPRGPAAEAQGWESSSRHPATSRLPLAKLTQARSLPLQRAVIPVVQTVPSRDALDPGQAASPRPRALWRGSAITADRRMASSSVRSAAPPGAALLSHWSQPLLPQPHSALPSATCPSPQGQEDRKDDQNRMIRMRSLWRTTHSQPPRFGQGGSLPLPIGFHAASQSLAAVTARDPPDHGREPGSPEWLSLSRPNGCSVCR